MDWAGEPDKLGKLLADVEVKMIRQRRKRARRMQAGTALVAAVCLVILGVWVSVTSRDTGSIGTEAAQRRVVALSDGSTAEFNAETDAKTDFRFGRRTVRLERGEAFFSVAKDSAHPFLVETPVAVVKVTGTKFNVRLAANGIPEVTLFEGSVDLQRDGRSFLNLMPGQQFDGMKDQVHPLSAEELSNVTAWRDGRLVLDGLTLGEAAARMAAYHGKRIDVAPEVAMLRLGGSCALDDLAKFLEFLPGAMSVQVLPRADGSYRIVAR